MKRLKKIKKELIIKKVIKPFGLNTKQAAAYIGCSESYLVKRRAVGHEPNYVNLGHKIIYPVPCLKNFLKKNLVSKNY